MNFVILGILVVLFIAVLVFVIKAAKEWRWFHIFSVLVTMLLAIILMFPTAGALKSRAAWHDLKEKLEKRRDQALADEKLIKHGDPADANVARGVIELTQELAKVGIEAGRTWRGLRMGNNPNIQSIRLTKPAPAAAPGIVPAAADDAAAAPAAAGPLVPTGLVVYGFSEAVIAGVESPLPTFFLGEFTVTASAETTVTLTPTGPLEANQIQRLQEGKASSWSLYELLPLDAHEPFMAEGATETAENLFGRVDQDLVNGLLSQNIRPETLQTYLDDGSRVDPDNLPPLLTRWVKVEFTKTYTIDVDSTDSSGALEGGFFDGIGRALDSRLKRIADEGKVKFSKGDLITVKEEEAKRLIDVEGVARLIDTYYVRPLNDYRFVLRRIRLRIEELKIRERDLLYEKQVIEDAQANTSAMFTIQQDDKVKLEQDLAQHQVEVKAIQGYRDEMKAYVDKTKQTLNRLYHENIQLEKQVQRIHQTLISAPAN